MSTMISRIQLVMIPSTDQDRSVAFYERLGFERRNDIPWGDGYRWVEVYPPGTPTGLALVPPGPGDPVGVATGVILNTDDIDATYHAFQSLGVDVDAALARTRSRPARGRRDGRARATHVLVPRSRRQLATDGRAVLIG
jgi:catechol 2,3-dioxygenase-like lactoylglutathione lyase family enzyme